MNRINPEEPAAFRLGDWLAEPDLNLLSRDGESVTIENKTMRVLVMLASSPGEVFSNEHLIESVWDGRPMAETPVYKSIANLRKALGDDSKSPQYIETIARKGYRLVADVEPTLYLSTGIGGNRLINRLPVLLGVAALLTFLVTLIWLSLEIAEPMGESKSVSEKSIAVLPFENVSGDPENDFFRYAIADELLSRFAKLPGLRVVARTSSFSLGGKIANLPKFARSLDVHYLLMGSVRQHGDMIWVTARLLKNDGTLIWTDSYDRRRESVFSTQDDIARAVMQGLKLHAGESFLVRAQPTADFAAYSAYLLGKEYLNRRAGNWAKLAAGAFEQAIRLDPGYAAPYAGLAITYVLESRQDKSKARRAEWALATALRLAPQLPQAHAAAGLAAMYRGTGPDYNAAVKSLRYALELDPSLVDARNWLHISLDVLGEREESLRVLEEAIRIDPLNPILNMNLGRKYHADGRLGEARAQMRRALTYPDTPAYVVQWTAQIDKTDGKLVDALERLKEGLAKGVFDADNNHSYAGSIAAYYTQLGMFDSANNWLAALTLPDNSSWRLAHYYAVLAPQKRYEQLAGHFQRYQATLSEERPLTLASRSLTGSFAVLRGDYATAIQVLEPIFEEGWVLDNAPGGGDGLIDTLNYLAVAYQKTGKVAEAQRLLKDAADELVDDRRGRTHVISDLLVREAVTYRLLGQRELANQRFREAVAAGWRQYYRAINDPSWDAFRGDPEFEQLMATVKEDVDLQRERVLAAERLHPFEPPTIEPQQL